MAELYSLQVVRKNTAKSVIVLLKNGIYSLNKVYEGLIEADVDPLTGKCYNYDYIRQQIMQAHQNLERSEQMASSGLKSLDTNLERLVQDEGKLERETNATKQTLDNLRKKQEFNEKILRVSKGSLDQAKRNLDSTKQTLQGQENRKQTAEIITRVGAELLVIPVIGWIAGSAMIIGGAVEMNQAEQAIREAEEEVKKSESEVSRYRSNVSNCEDMISQTRRDISQKDDKLKQTHEEIQKMKKQIESVADFQKKARKAVHLLGVLSGRASVAEHQTRRFILQEPVMKVMEDVMKATEQITGNELLYNNDLPKLIHQMKRNHQRLAAICVSEEEENMLTLVVMF